MSPKVKKETPEDKKLRILQGAEEVFIEKGFHAASMKDIAVASGISTAHLYNFYQNKTALALAVQEKMSGETFQMLTDAMKAASAGQNIDLRGLFNPRKASLTLTVMTEATRNPEIRKRITESGERLKRLLMKHYGIQETDKDRLMKLELSMNLFLGLMIGSAFSIHENYDHLKEILVDTNRWLMDNGGCCNKVTQGDKE